MEWRCPECSAVTHSQDVCTSCQASIYIPERTPAPKPSKPDKTRKSKTLTPPEDEPRLYFFAAEKSPLDDALAAHRSLQRSKRLGLAALLVALIAAAYFGVDRFAGRHVRARWMDDPKLSADVVVAIHAPVAGEPEVLSICRALADTADELDRELDAATGGSPEAAAALIRWEAIEDGRATIAERPMAPNVGTMMSECATHSTRMGNYLSGVANGTVSPATSPLGTIADELRSALGRTATPAPPTRTPEPEVRSKKRPRRSR